MKLYPDEILTKVSEPYEKEEFLDINTIFSNMFGILEINGGVGLAAPQIGISKRAFIVKTEELTLHAVNPDIKTFGNIVVDYEGCLSLPGIIEQVPRYDGVILSAYNSEGNFFCREFHDLESRIIQHEFDHINGIMFFDRVSRQLRKRILKKWEKLKQ